MAGNVPLTDIHNALWHRVYKSETAETDISADLDKEHWPLELDDIVTEDAVARGKETVTVEVHERTSVDGYELRRRNATGGDYVDIEQNISVEATLPVETDRGDRTIARDGGSVQFFCEVRTTGGRSYRGETPPF